MSKVGRNDPCPCGSGNKFKKCCALKPAAPVVAEPLDAKETNRTNLNTQLARYAPEVSLDDVTAKIREALAQTKPPTPVQVIETLFNDDNLSLRNKKQADRLFKAFMSVWNDIATSEKSSQQNKQ
jgi:hypothetical protein